MKIKIWWSKAIPRKKCISVWMTYRTHWVNWSWHERKNYKRSPNWSKNWESWKIRLTITFMRCRRLWVAKLTVRSTPKSLFKTSSMCWKPMLWQNTRNHRASSLMQWRRLNSQKTIWNKWWRISSWRLWLVSTRSLNNMKPKKLVKRMIKRRLRKAPKIMRWKK